MTRIYLALEKTGIKIWDIDKSETKRDLNTINK